MDEGSGDGVPDRAAASLDVAHLLTYFVAHEAHHRGQLVLSARALGQRLSPPIVNGLWQWTTRRREVGRLTR